MYICTVITCICICISLCPFYNISPKYVLCILPSIQITTTPIPTPQCLSQGPSLPYPIKSPHDKQTKQAKRNILHIPYHTIPTFYLKTSRPVLAHLLTYSPTPDDCDHELHQNFPSLLKFKGIF